MLSLPPPLPTSSASPTQKKDNPHPPPPVMPNVTSVTPITTTSNPEQRKEPVYENRMRPSAVPMPESSSTSQYSVIVPTGRTNSCPKKKRNVPLSISIPSVSRSSVSTPSPEVKSSNDNSGQTLSVPSTSQLIIFNTPPTPNTEVHPDPLSLIPRPLTSTKSSSESNEMTLASTSKSLNPSFLLRPSPPVMMTNGGSKKQLTVRPAVSDPTSPNVPFHVDLDRRHSDSASWGLRLEDQQRNIFFDRGGKNSAKHTYQNTSIAIGN